MTVPELPPSDKVAFVKGLKEVLKVGSSPKTDDPYIDEVSEQLDELDDVLSEPSKYELIAQAAAKRLAGLVGIDISKAEDRLDEAITEEWDEPGEEGKRQTRQTRSEQAAALAASLHKHFKALIESLQEAAAEALDLGTDDDQEAVEGVLTNATEAYTAFREERRKRRLARVKTRQKRMLSTGFTGTIIAAPKSKMLVENPSVPGEFHEIDMSSYGAGVGHKVGEIFLFEDGFVRKTTRDPGGLTVVEEGTDDEGEKLYKVNVMSESEFLAAAKMGAIEELFGGHGGGYTEVVDSGTILDVSGDTTIDEPRLVYRVGRHAPGLTLDQLKDRLRKGRVAHDAAWAAQGRATSKFTSHEVYVEAYDKSVKVISDAISAGTLPTDGTNYYSSYKISVNHGKSIGVAFERTLSNNLTTSLPTASPDEFGTPSPTTRKQIPDTDIARVPDNTLVWSMANFNVSPTGDWTLAQFWPQAASAGGATIAGGDINGTHYQGNKGPLVGSGPGTAPEDSDTIVGKKTGA